jgi:hypothetical protein
LSPSSIRGHPPTPLAVLMTPRSPRCQLTACGGASRSSTPAAGTSVAQALGRSSADRQRARSGHPRFVQRGRDGGVGRQARAHGRSISSVARVSVSICAARLHRGGQSQVVRR